MSNRLPSITHLQFIVLGRLLQVDQPGQILRHVLRQAGVRQTGPAFYQMMARLEDAGLVEGWYVQKMVEGQAIKERRYRLTATGAEAWADTRDFYFENVRLAQSQKGLADA